MRGYTVDGVFFLGRGRVMSRKIDGEALAMDEEIRTRMFIPCWMDSMKHFLLEISIYRKRRSKANIVLSDQSPCSPSESRPVAFYRIRATGSTVPLLGARGNSSTYSSASPTEP